MKPERIRFSSHPRPFRVLESQCIDPTCACSEVTFDLVEVMEAGTTVGTRLRLEIRIEPETWLEIQAPVRPAVLAELVQEFLRDYPAEERLIFQQVAQKKQLITRRLRDYHFDAEALAGHRLVSFDELVSELDSTEPAEFLDRLEHDGRTYLIRDLYCANPSCLCSEVHLEFLLYTPPSTPDGQAVAEPHFMARVSLAGLLHIEKSFALTDAQAMVLLDAWWQGHRSVLEGLRWRYDKIKEIGRRDRPIGRVPAGATPLRRPAPPQGRPGRNDPCPCGSGKKYKKCCGR